MPSSYPTKTVARISAAVATVLIAHTAASAGMLIKSTPCETTGLRQAMLQQVNAARARGFNCGGQVFGPARPVSWNDRLASAAMMHSKDMAETNYFDHQSPRGTRAPHRAEAQGYNWLSVGENIAAGEMYTAQNVVDGWLKSPSHCSNIMEPGYAELAVACESRPGSTYGKYWTMVLGRR
jgi:uncharacterized protein YkwD